MQQDGYDWMVPHTGWTSGCTQGCSGHRRGSGYFNAKPVMLKESDTKLTLRVLADRSVVDAFAMGGRGAMTRRVYPKYATSTGASLVYMIPAGAAGAALEPPKVTINVWPMSSGYGPSPPSPTLSSSGVSGVCSAVYRGATALAARLARRSANVSEFQRLWLVQMASRIVASS